MLVCTLEWNMVRWVFVTWFVDFRVRYDVSYQNTFFLPELYFQIASSHTSRPRAPLVRYPPLKCTPFMTSPLDSWRLSWRRCPVPQTHQQTDSRPVHTTVCVRTHSLIVSHFIYIYIYIHTLICRLHNWASRK
jgi:hypothetical protein